MPASGTLSCGDKEEEQEAGRPPRALRGRLGSWGLGSLHGEDQQRPGFQQVAWDQTFRLTLLEQTENSYLVLEHLEANPEPSSC